MAPHDHADRGGEDYNLKLKVELFLGEFLGYKRNLRSCLLSVPKSFQYIPKRFYVLCPYFLLFKRWLLRQKTDRQIFELKFSAKKDGVFCCFQTGFINKT